MSATSVAAQNAAFIAAKEKEAAATSGTTTTTSKTSAEASQNQLSSDINFFLTMLTTQLKNQDPTSPLDTNQFTQQIAQYSSVQQQVTMNSNLEKLLAAGKQSSLTTAVGYIGKEIETAGKTGLVLGGQGAFAYVLPKEAANVTITISNANGQIVFTGKGTNQSGRNIAVWDGKNSSTGDQEPDGVYTIAVTATDANNKDIVAETRAVGIVTGVETDAKTGDAILNLGQSKVNFSDIIAVRPASRITTSTTTTDTGTTDTQTNTSAS
jgi:flagellar basal-body rod modification protein FlgD